MNSSATASSASIDVEAAVISNLRQQLDDRGYQHSDLSSVFDLAVRLENIQFRTIPVAHRTWCVARTMAPIDPSLQAGVDRLRAAVEAGEDLTPFQSTKRLVADFHDPLLTDWAIHHFHLGTGQDRRHPGFVSRTGPVLFAAATDSEFLVVGIDDHGVWEDPDLLQVLHDNWPERIARYRVTDHLANALTEAHQVKAFRKSGINGAVVLPDGATYTNFHNGKTTSGRPVNVVRSAQRLVRTVRLLQQRLDKELSLIVTQFAQSRSVDPAMIQFTFAVESEGASRQKGYYLDDGSTGHSVHLQ